MSPVVVLYPDQPVLHDGRRATFLHMSRGEAIIRYDEPLARELAARHLPPDQPAA